MKPKKKIFDLFKILPERSDEPEVPLETRRLLIDMAREGKLSQDEMEYLKKRGIIEDFPKPEYTETREKKNLTSEEIEDIKKRLDFLESEIRRIRRLLG